LLAWALMHFHQVTEAIKSKIAMAQLKAILAVSTEELVGRLVVANTSYSY